MTVGQAESMFQSIVELQPRSAGGDGGMSVQVHDANAAIKSGSAPLQSPRALTHKFACWDRSERSRRWTIFWTACQINSTCTK
jgi:hypothetical protein